MTTYDETRLSESDRALIHALLFNAGALAESESKVWHPKDGESVWKLYSDGSSDTIIFLCKGDSTENSWKQGNIFPTKEAAEFEANRRAVIAELKRHAEEFNTTPIDWHDAQQLKWCLTYHTEGPVDRRVRSSKACIVSGGDRVYFISEDIANAAIEKIGKDRLIKYYFNIK